MVECDLEHLSSTLIVFRWGKTEERLTPGVAMGRFKARVTDVLNLGKKKREESRSFHRAVGYYAGLCRFYGRELSAAELGWRGRRGEVLEAVRGAVDR